MILNFGKDAGGIGKIVPRIAEFSPRAGIKVYALKTGVENVITLVGSMPGGTMHTSPMLAHVYSEMLLEGTKKKNRSRFHEAMEARGIELAFHVDYDWLTFSLRTLAENTAVALALLVEALTEPALDANALGVVKERTVTSLQHAKSDTRSRAHTAFVRKLYPRDHKNWTQDSDEAIREVRAISRGDLLKLSQKYGVGEMIVVAVGDVSVSELREEFTRAMKTMRRGSFDVIRESKNPLLREASSGEIVVHDKTSIDVFLGQSLALAHDNPDFYPLTLAMSVLGSGFTGRLMSRVRGRDGLTYHTTARVGGFSGGAQGFWFAYGSFAPELYARGVEALRREVSEFVARGITEEELAHRKTMLAGEHQVGLSTSSSLANTIMATLEDGRPLSIIDEYPEKFAMLTRDEVNTVVKKYLDDRVLVCSAAGSIPN